MTVAGKALAMLVVLACGAGCVAREPEAGVARDIEQAKENAKKEVAKNWTTVDARTADAPDSPRLGHPAAPSDASTYTGQLPAAYGATAQESGFYFERVIIHPVQLDWLPEHVVVGDVTADGRPDVVMSMSASGSNGRVLIRIYAQMPDGSLAAPVEIKVERAVNWLHSLEFADLDSNGVQEIMLADDTGLTTISRESGRFVTRWQASNGRYAALASIDANGDGHMDVFAKGVEYGSRFFLGDGQGGFSSVEHLPTAYGSYALAEASDFTADGLPDLLVSQSGAYYVHIYPFQRGFGLQSQPITIDVMALQAGPSYGATVGDIDRDGRPDLVITDHGRTGTPRGVRVLYRGTGNEFARSVLMETPGYYSYPSALRIADLDGNGYPDIVVMFDSNDNLGYFLQGPSGFAPVVFQRTDDDGWTSNHYGENSFAIADVNSDRCPDIVLAEVSSSLRIFYGRNCQITLPQMSTPLPPGVL